MKILMTGASGFIGKHIVDILRQKYNYNDVLILGNSRIGNDYFQWLPANGYSFSPSYLAENAVSDIDTMLLCGSWTPKKSSDSNDLDKAYGNIISLMALLHLKCPNLQRLLYISSLDVYSDNIDNNAKYSEKSPVNPATMYGWSKLYCEKMVQSFSNNKGLSYCILRLGHVYGEGEEVYRKVIPELIRKSLKNEPVTIYGDGNAIRSFVYIRDVAAAIVSALENLSKFSKGNKENQGNLPEIINITGDEPMTINELAGIIIEESGSTSQIVHIETSVPNRNYYFDASLMKEYLLGETTPFRNGLKNEVSYMRTHLL